MSSTCEQVVSRDALQRFGPDLAPSGLHVMRAGTALRAVHTISYVLNTASGPSYSVPSLCQALAELGVETSLHALAPSFFAHDALYQCEQHPTWCLARRLGVSWAMSRRLHEVARTADLIHNHNLWLMPNVYPHWAARRGRCRLVHSPRGTLSPAALRVSWLRKRLMWWLLQGTGLRTADCLHATSQAEYQDIRRCGLKAPVAVIPNGIHLPVVPRPRQPGANRRRRLLFLARIHPIKGVDVLLRSWRQVESTFPQWELQIAGPPDHPTYLPSMKQLARVLDVRRATFTGPAYGQDKTAMFWNSDLYVLPTHSENFGITVAEALAHGVPAITTRAAPWAGLQLQRCGWWIDRGEAALTACLHEALAATPDQLHSWGARGRAWMEREFSWPRVAAQMRDTYLWLVGGGAPPDWVRID